MKKILLSATAVLLLVVGIWWSVRPKALTFGGPYQAVLLDNGQIYYARIERIDPDFAVLTDVYYVQNQVDAQTKQVKNILIRRGNEWHAPNRSIINARHIVMIEPVTPGSQVSSLIAQLKTKTN